MVSNDLGFMGLTHLLDASSDLFFVIDYEEKRIVYHNSRFGSFFNINADQDSSLALASFQEFIHPADLHQLNASLVESTEGSVIIRIKERPLIYKRMQISFKVNLSPQPVVFCVGKLMDAAHPDGDEDMRRDEPGKKIQQALQQYGRMFEISDNGIFVFDLAGRLFKANKTALGMIGLDAAEDFTTPEALQENFTLIDKTGREIPLQDWPIFESLQDKRVSNRELRLRIKGSESDVYMVYSSLPLTDSSGKKVATLVRLKDISRQKEYELRLAEKSVLLAAKNNQLKAIIENSLAAMALIDAEPPYRVIAHNKTYKDIWPGSPYAEKMTGKAVNEYAPEPVLKNLIQVFNGPNPEKQGKRVCEIPHNGNTNYWNCSVNPVFSDGKLIAFVHSLVDITEQVETKKKLEELAARYKTIFETVDDGLFLIRPDGIVAEVNKAGLELHGYSTLDEMTSDIRNYKSNVELLDLEGNVIPFDQWPSVRSLKGETALNYEGIRRLIKTGEELFVSINSKPVYANNEVIAVVHSLKNITAIKENEIKLQKLFNKIAANNQLLENLLYIAAHDLKGPLGNFRLLFYLIDECETCEEKAEMIPQLKAVVDGLEKTILGLSEILEIQSISEDQPSTVMLEDLTDKTISEFRINPAIKEFEANCNFKNAPSLVYIESFLQSILKNLISNSIKYRKQNEPLRIAIESTRMESQILLKYSDNGIGIDLHKFGKKIFRPFQRFTKQSEGTGVGLYLINNIVSRNGGFIEIESELGKGATFNCYLKEY